MPGVHYLELMGQHSSQREPSVALVPGPVARAGLGADPGQAEAARALPRIAPFGAHLRLPRLRVALAPLLGRLALGMLIVGALGVVAFASGRPSVLVPTSSLSFPHWESGPLHGVFGGLTRDFDTLQIGFSLILVAMTLAYVVAVSCVRALSMRLIAICVVALHLILLMSPPLQLTDLFNYLGYARLGALHHFNPYAHVISQQLHDPVYRFSTWHHLRSPYGPLFTAATYPLGLVSLPVGYWALKVATVLASLGFVALVWKCARLLGRDPRFAVLFVAANPIFLMYAIGGFHNDFFMLVPSTAAIALLLARRDRAAGAVLVLAVAVKFTAVLLLPFLLLAARPSRRRGQILLGAAAAAVPVLALSVALFGFSLPNLSDQSTLLTGFSIPNLVGLTIGLGGGAPALLRVANVALVLVVAYLVRRRGDWLAGAGWSTFALIASLAWLVPWYIIWLLPLAALATSLRLRRATLVLTVFLVLTFMPEAGVLLYDHGIDPMGGAPGHASKALAHRLER
ncbi:MAG: glycosyltransferase 87 family protein [Solirubrobacteraceae bacterium]